MAECNIRRLDAAHLNHDQIAELLSPLREPVLLTGVIRRFASAQDQCASIDGLAGGSCSESSLQVGLSSPAAVGEYGPLTAPTRSWGGHGFNMTIREFIRRAIRPRRDVQPIGDGDASELTRKTADEWQHFRARELPHDAYCFFAATPGSRLAARYAELRSLFDRTAELVEENEDSRRGHAPKRFEASVTPERLAAIEDARRARREDGTRLRMILGPRSTGTGWHKHGPAVAALLEGRKRWYVHAEPRCPKTSERCTWNATWLDELLTPTLPRPSRAIYVDPRRPAPGPTMERHLYFDPIEWERRALPAGREHPQLWESVWRCTQVAGELIYIPDQQHHTVINVESALALAVQDTGDGEVKQQQYAKKNGLQECGLGCPPPKRPPSRRAARN